MTHFNLSLFNFSGAGLASYADIARGLQAQLMEHGHTFAVNDNFFPPPIVNLIAEGFNRQTLALLLRQHRAGMRFALLVTEMPTRIGKHAFLWNYRTDTYWTERAHFFIEALPAFEAAWCLVDEAAQFVGRFIPAVDIKIGYSPRLVQSAIAAIEPGFDFCFFGSRTPRRDVVVASFQKAGYSVFPVWHMPNIAERNAVIGRAKVSLDIKIEPWWPLISTSRIAASLYCGRPCVCEPRGVDATQIDWEDVAAFAKSDGEFIKFAASFLPRWQIEYRRQQVAFETRFPAKECMTNALALIRHYEPKTIANSVEPRLVESHRRLNLVEAGNHAYLVPQRLGPFDYIRDCDKPGVRRFDTVSAAHQTLFDPKNQLR